MTDPGDGGPNSNHVATKFCAAHRDDLIRYFRRLCGDSWLAEDMAHDSLLIVIKYWARIDSPEPYLHRVARRRWIAELRRRTRLPSDPLLDEDKVATHKNKRQLDPTCDEVAAKIDLRGYFVGLTPCQQQVVLFRIDGRSPSEISEILGISVSTVRSHWSNAQLRLKLNLLGSDERTGGQRR